MKSYRAYIAKTSNLPVNIQQSLDYIKWNDSIQSDSMVFVKPNFTYPFYKKGITTTPLILNELLGILKDRADRVIVGESDGGNRSFSAETAFQGHNMQEICRETGAELINLSRIPSTYITDIIQKKKVKVQVPKLLIDDVDCFISVPVLKVHVMTTTSLSMKNLWGCYPDPMRCLHHKHLSRKLALLTKIINPQISIIDGTYALNGHGPMYGDAVNSNLLISSNNPVVADTLGTRIMGIPVNKVEHIIYAEKEGLGTSQLDTVQMNDDWSKFTMNFHVSKTILDNISTILFNSKLIAKIVMDSPFKPAFYFVGAKLRNKQEKETNEELQKGYL